MEQIVDKNKCMGCSTCAQSCPKQCISMKADREGFLHPIIDQSHCIDCKRCQQVCPVLMEDRAVHLPTQAYGAHAANDRIVAESSSGGVFTLLSQIVLNQGGVVFGAAFDGTHHVKHIAVHSEEELSQLRGSKYVQSNIGKTFQEAKQYLQKDTWVLYSGMPCQIAALKSYLGREYDKLLCVDTICHSAPSPKVWDAFLTELEQETGSLAVSANFRDKKTDWEHYHLSVDFADGKQLSYSGGENMYMQAFIQGLSTRPACYSCKFKGDNHYSDITLGDFWGVRGVSPEALYENGTSLVLVHSEKGQYFLNKCQKEMEFVPVDFERAIQPNPAYSVPSVPHRNRDSFFASLGQQPFNKLVSNCLAPTKKELLLEWVRCSFPVRALRCLKRRLSVAHPSQDQPQQ